MNEFIFSEAPKNKSSSAESYSTLKCKTKSNIPSNSMNNVKINVSNKDNKNI